MKLTLSVETSQPSGKAFRMALGITIPVAIVGMVLAIFGLS